jgi:hypothetical protein
MPYLEADGKKVISQAVSPYAHTAGTVSKPHRDLVNLAEKLPGLASKCPA